MTHAGKIKRVHIRISFQRLALLAAVALIALAAFWLAQQIIHRAEGAEPKTAPAAEAKKPAQDPFAWKSLFDGKTLKGWKVPNFGGEGEVKVEKGAIVMAMGNPMSGIVWTGEELPKIDYEVTLEGRRGLGNDFFCTTTFPVGESYCSLVVGGWGGTVVGLSSVDFYDASDNSTTTFQDFKTGQWYRIRLRITKAKVEAWVDDEQVVDQAVPEHRFSIRDEVDLCRPFGICPWVTEGAVRNIRLRKLRPEEAAAAGKSKE